ncbi:MAG: cupredoxin domain-containing protein [Terriglobia bacterium]
MKNIVACCLGAVIYFSTPTLEQAILGAQSDSTPKVVKIGAAAPADAPVKEVEITAKKYEFNPSSLEVPLHTLVKIHLKAADREHGFEFKGIKESCVKFSPGETVTIEYFADKTGNFEFGCCKYCGLGHGKMKGTLVVK